MTFSISSAVTAPGLKIVGISVLISIIVDSTPTSVGPSSKIPAILPSKS